MHFCLGVPPNGARKGGFKGKRARILLDQLRCVDKVRLVGVLRQIDTAIWHPVLMQMLA